MSSISARFAAAAEHGRALRAIHADAQLWRLSRDAWIAGCLELAGWTLEQDLEAARRRLEDFPYLNHELAIRARLWADQGQDRPAVFHGFADADRFPGCHAELLASGLSIAQVSGVAAYLCAQILDQRQHPWGRAASVDPDTGDGALALRPHMEALAMLDRELPTTIRLCDVTWIDGKPTLKIAGLTLEVGAFTARACASAIAEAASLRVLAEAA